MALIASSNVVGDHAPTTLPACVQPPDDALDALGRRPRSPNIRTRIARLVGDAYFVWLRLIGRLGERFPWVYEWDVRSIMRRLIANTKRHEAADAMDPASLRWSERSEFSQNGEDGIIEELLHRIGETNRWFVEIGASDGSENCTRRLADLGWSGVWVEADPESAERARRIAPSKVEVIAEPALRSTVGEMLGSTGVPPAPDLLVVDIDSDDLGVLNACLELIAPRIVVAEYNGAFPPAGSWSLPDRYDNGWDGSFRHGASLRALTDALGHRGYRLAYCESQGVNSFFVRVDQLDLETRRSTTGSVEEAFRSPAFTAHPFGHPRSGRAVAAMTPLTVEQIRAISFRNLCLDSGTTPEGPGALIAFRFEIENRSGEVLTSGGQMRSTSAPGGSMPTAHFRLAHLEHRCPFPSKQVDHAVFVSGPAARAPGEPTSCASRECARGWLGVRNSVTTRASPRQRSKLLRELG